MIVTTQWRIVALLAVIAASVAVIAPRIGNAQPASPVAAPVASPEAAALLARGEEIYTTVCMACHLAGGKGVPGIYPALSGDPFVTLDNPEPVTSVVLTGRGGMPRFEGAFKDADIAAIVTYIRGAFGNHASAVSPEYVAEVRDSLTAAAATPSNTGLQLPQGEEIATPSAGQ